MLLAVIPMTVSAEEIKPEPTTSYTAPTAPAGTRKVYLGATSNITDNEAPEGSETNPYTTLKTAYVEATKDNTDVEIVLIGNVVEFPNPTATAAVQYYIEAATDFTKTVYINGQDYAIDFTAGNEGAATVCGMGANTVFNNIKLSVTNNKGIWLCANTYDLTMGNNIICDVGSGYVSIAGSAFNASNAHFGANDGYDISIYSGVYCQVYAGHRGNDATALNGNINLNVYGGTFGRAGTTSTGAIYSEANVSSKYNAGCKISINIYKFDLIRRIEGVQPTNLSTSLTYYNGSRDSVEKQLTNGYGGIFADGANTYDDFYVGVQNTTITDNKYSVRFVAVIGGELESYTKLGFDVTVNGTDDYSNECRNVYSSIAGKNDATYKAEQLGGKYIFAFAIKDIPTSVGTVTFTVKPYAYIGETKYEGTAYTVTYKAGVYDGSAVSAN